MTTYSGEDIKDLEYPQSVRVRPTMYTGSINRSGNNHLAREIYDNAIDEAMNGHGDKIDIKVSNKEGYCTVIDRGRGIPVDNGAAERIFCKLHSSGKFDNDSYKTSGGLNGVGSAIVNALSKRTIVSINRDGYNWTLEFSKGEVVKKLKKGKKTKTTGTSVTFYPDEEIMNTDQFDIESIIEDVKMRSYLNKNVELNLHDIDNGKVYKNLHAEGIKEYISDNVETIFHDPIIFDVEEKYEKGKKKKKESIRIEVALAYGKDPDENILSFANSIRTYEGGEHETGFRFGVTNALKSYFEDHVKLTKAEQKLEITGEDYRSGLNALISVSISDPEFTGQNKSKLGNLEARGLTSTLVRDNLFDFLVNNEKIAKKIVTKVISNAKARVAAKRARDAVAKKGNDQLSIMSDLGKLADCMTDNPEEAELFIVEGKMQNCSL